MAERARDEGYTRCAGTGAYVRRREKGYLEWQVRIHRRRRREWGQAEQVGRQPRDE